MKVLVTGANGQLGKCLADVAPQFETLDLTFKTRAELDITDKQACKDQITDDYDFCINTAAYTAVDAAEDNWPDAQAANHLAIFNLIEACKLSATRLVHISTDYVFPGEKSTPYVETDRPNAKTFYGESKLRGEREIISSSNGIIIRTSWLYSPYGHNFLKTMLKMGKKLNQIHVVSDQVGTPTSAHDLASFILSSLPLFQFKKSGPNIYHYTNSGVASWYDFAVAIMDIAQLDCIVQPVGTDQYPTKAKRPHYSVLSTRKIQKDFCLYPPQHWRYALDQVMARLAKLSEAC